MMIPKHNMSIGMRIIFFIGTLFLLGNHTYLHSELNKWEELTPGIVYREYFREGPTHIYVARMDRSEPNVFLETGIAQGRISGGLETVRQIANRYDQAINYWGEQWGNRNEVFVAINGSFYNTDTGIPTGGQFHSGWYAKRFDDLESNSGFAWKLDRSIFFGGCVAHRSSKQLITHFKSGEVFHFDGINIPSQGNQLVIITPQYERNAILNDDEIEILIELSAPLLLIPPPNSVEGRVREIRVGTGAVPIPFDHIVISASGKIGNEIKKLFNIGDEIGISQEINHFAPDCQSPNSDDWTKTYAGTAGSYIFLNNGELQGFNDLGSVLRTARTAIAYDDRYIYFVVVHDREPITSMGMSIMELAVFTKYTLGAAWGMALDGGGSSTIVVNGKLMNRLETDDPRANDENVERAVANAVLMVGLKPKETSQHFHSGESVRVVEAKQIAIRVGPGTNFPELESLSEFSRGEILDHPMNGIFAKGSFWWKVRIGNVQGWVAENWLDRIQQ